MLSYRPKGSISSIIYVTIEIIDLLVTLVTRMKKKKKIHQRLVILVSTGKLVQQRFTVIRECVESGIKV